MPTKMHNKETFFNISHDLLCILDRQGYYTDVNPSFLSLLGFTKNEVLGHQFTNFIHPEDIAPTQQTYEQATKGRHNRIIENRYRSKDGLYYWISWSSIVVDESGFFYAAGQNITEQKRLQEALARQQQESQRKLTKAIIQTQEKERAQISRELHDNVNQVLTTVKLLMELCRDGQVNREETLNRAIKLQQEIICEIRSLSKRLSAPSLGKIRLQDSVEELVNSIAETNRLNITLDTSGIEGLEVEEEVHLAVYRILQEHFTNIIKHAAASHVNAVLDFAENELILEVKDDGVGFDPASRSGGMGITNMKTRAESVNGTFSIKSAPGTGCLLTVHLPIHST